MFMLPAAIPVTTPLTLIEPIAALLLAHVPPDVASVKEIVDPSHTFTFAPLIAATAVTVVTASLLQPVGSK